MQSYYRLKIGTEVFYMDNFGSIHKGIIQESIMILKEEDESKFEIDYAIKMEDGKKIFKKHEDVNATLDGLQYQIKDIKKKEIDLIFEKYEAKEEIVDAEYEEGGLDVHENLEQDIK